MGSYGKRWFLKVADFLSVGQNKDKLAVLGKFSLADTFHLGNTFSWLRNFFMQEVGMLSFPPRCLWPSWKVSCHLLFIDRLRKPIQTPPTPPHTPNPPHTHHHAWMGNRKVLSVPQTSHVQTSTVYNSSLLISVSYS